MLGFAVVAAHEAAVAGQPGQACLDDPAVTAKAVGGLDAFAGDPHGDAAPLELGAERADVAGLVGVEFLGPAAGPAASAADRDD